MLTTAKTPLYNRFPTAEQTHLDVLVRTYQAAGLNAPTLAVGIRDRINTAPTVHAVASRLADEALTTTDPDTWYTEALDQLRTAQAAEALAKAFNTNYQDAVRRHIPALQSQAAEDLAPVFNKHAKALIAAAKKLPANQPLDMAANVEADTASEYKTARTALAMLGTLASIYKTTAPGDVPVSINKLLPVLDLPSAVKEQIARSIGESVKVLKESQLGGTRAIRQLAADAREDVDLALINVARGHYNGVTLALATPDTLRERRRAATIAHQREHVTEPGSRVYVG
ncbi:hypothetical protein NicSoilE8_27190 [Arthrobacter sp. NicSoilE8]|nr:hypothetical protein NicSoilE8_27190 [Arthrobacter sp. NicSoilE8]